MEQFCVPVNFGMRGEPVGLLNVAGHVCQYNEIRKVKTPRHQMVPRPSGWSFLFPYIQCHGLSAEKTFAQLKIV